MGPEPGSALRQASLTPVGAALAGPSDSAAGEARTTSGAAPRGRGVAEPSKGGAHPHKLNLLRGGGPLPEGGFPPPDPYGREGPGWVGDGAFVAEVLARHPLLAAVCSEDKFALVMLIMLGPPCVMLGYYTFDPSVAYFAGPSGLLVACLTACFLAAGQVLLLHGGHLPRRNVCLLAGLFPVAGMFLVSMQQRKVAGETSARLIAEDCHAFPEKLQLERAWRAAAAIRAQCVAQRTEAHGEDGGRVPVEEVESVLLVQDCPGYSEGLKTWSEEWGYLELLELTERCVGWCEESAGPIWTAFAVATPRDRCSLAAGAKLRGPLYRSAEQIQIYSLVVLVGGFLLSLN